jgi:hypothetical protein
MAARFFCAEFCCFVFEHVGIIRFDPAQAGGQFEPPRARVKPGAEVDHRLNLPALNGIHQHFVQGSGANPDAKAHHPEQRNVAGNRHAAFARQALGEGVADEAVLARRLQRAARRHHQGRVADVLDFILHNIEARFILPRSPNPICVFTLPVKQRRAGNCSPPLVSCLLITDDGF